MARIEKIDNEGQLKNKKKKKFQEPSFFKVVLHNDDYTTTDFVVDVIMKVFHKPAIEATRIMLDVHKKGLGLVGVYPYDIAATKVFQVTQMAKASEFPLKCTMEKE